MLIQKAYADDIPVPTITTTGTQNPAMPQAPSPTESIAWNMGMVLILVVLFYMLLIKPQQRRLQEHTKMLSALKKGDKVVTGGGLVGTVDKVNDEDGEMVIDLGNGVKVTAVRSSIQGKDNPLLRKGAANMQKEKGES